MDTSKEHYDLNDLIALMQRLRSPNDGCPWDIEQDFNSIKPHTIEEAYEVADAIERDDMDDLKDELGDLLFQVVFHAQMADEKQLFSMNDIIDHVTKKMIFRHPHVFDDQSADTADDVKNNIWEQQKEKEKAHKGTRDDAHYLDSVTMNLPSLLVTDKIQKRVRKIGFQYPTFEAALDKLDEEIKELKDAVKNDDIAHINEEYGDVLMVACLLGRHCDADNPEEVLRQTNLKFIKRFNAMEDELKSENIALKDATIEQMTKAWLKIK